jgi:hypothetical protein
MSQHKHRHRKSFLSSAGYYILVVILIVNVLLNTLWLDMLYGKGFLAILPMRTVKNLIMWPIDSFIFFTITRLIEQTGIFSIFRKPAAS